MSIGNILLKVLHVCSVAHPSIALLNMTFFITGSIKDLKDLFIYTDFPQNIVTPKTTLNGQVSIILTTRAII